MQLAVFRYIYLHTALYTVFVHAEDLLPLITTALPAQSSRTWIV